MVAIQKLRNKQGFTILELMISMTLFALIITSVLVSVESLSVVRIKTLNRVALLEELYFFSEQLFTGIKDGGTLDYEEYWNRQAVGIATSSGHYTLPTGVGNYGSGGNFGTTVYGSGIYLCRSNNSASMGTGGCLSNYNNSADGQATGLTVPPNFNLQPQRYGEYLAQFTDYNGNSDADLGDENTDMSGSIVGDDDDRSIGDVPGISTGAMQELYLINKTAKTRTYFRWNIQQDPNNLAIVCDYVTTASGKIITNSGCIGNVQILRLKGKDLGLSHSGDTSDTNSYNGIVDTWVCTENTQCTGPILPSSLGVISTGSGNEWINLFPSTINVKNLSFKVYPIKDPWLSWAASDCSVSSCISPFIHPYARMNLEMGFSWGKRRTLRNDDPTISISTSISLSDFE